MSGLSEIRTKMRDSGDVVWLITSLFSGISVVFMVVDLATNLGKGQTFCFFAGEATMIAAIALGFDAGYRKSKFAFFGMVIFFVVASTYFVQAAWFPVR